MRKSQARRISIFTGASSGLGREFARQWDDILPDTIEFWLLGRNKERLEETASGLKHRCRIFPIDMQKDEDMQAFSRQLHSENPRIVLLVNAAGYGRMGRFSQVDLSEQLGQIRTNCEALSHMSGLCLPYMGRGSRILQLASAAAFLPQPGFAIYAATKAYVLHFSQALARELAPKGIGLCCVCPGPVDTAFFSIAEQDGHILPIKKWAMAQPQVVVRQAIHDARKGRTMSIYGPWMRAFYALSRCLPKEVFFAIMDGMAKE